MSRLKQANDLRIVKIDGILTQHLRNEIDESETIRQVYLAVKDEFEPYCGIDMSYTKDDFIESLKKSLSERKFKLLSDQDIDNLADRVSSKIDCSGMYEDIDECINQFARDHVRDIELENQEKGLNKILGVDKNDK
jgi:hypothetical protein